MSLSTVTYISREAWAISSPTIHQLFASPSRPLLADSSFPCFNMFFHCRRKQRPPPVFPRTPCARLGCNRRALRCESHERGITFYSFYCKDHACRHRAGNVMCPNHKQAGETRYCEDRTSRQPKPPSAAAAAADPSSQTPAAGPRTAAVPAKQPTGTRHGHTVLDVSLPLSHADMWCSPL